MPVRALLLEVVRIRQGAVCYCCLARRFTIVETETTTGLPGRPAYAVSL